MSRKKPVWIIVVLLVFSITVCGFPQPSATYGTAQATPQSSSIQRQADPPSSTTRLIREYALPMVPTTTIAFLGPRRGPYGIVYDIYGKIWVTDFNRDAIYRITPTTNLNTTTTTAEEWLLPITQGGRCPAYIVVNETRQVVWFTDPTSRQISRLNWSTGVLDDWNLATVPRIGMPLDLVIVGSMVWFTALNDTRFYSLDARANKLTPYALSPGAGAGPTARPTKIATNGTHLFLTDWKYDNLYVFPVPTPQAPTPTAQVYPLPHGAFTWDLDLDPSNNVWITQWLSSLVDEQLAHSTNKSKLNVIDYSYETPLRGMNATVKNTLNVTVEVTPVTPSVFPGYLNITEDPLVVWHVPTTVSAVTYVPPPARPFEIAASADCYGWYTEPIYNHIGVVRPDENDTLLYGVPTAQSWVVCIDVQPGQGLNPYHVWFTEYLSGKIGELFNATIVDVRACPSLSAQYPPPDPGSIRWTPGVEIWFDAPSNGYDAAHHDSGERGATNHLYARVKNMGSSSLTSISVNFYWYHNTSVSIASNYIPLPPTTPSSQRWTLIGTATIASLPAGSSTDVYVPWSISSNMPTSITVGVQVSVGSDSNLYDNIGYCNFTLTSTSPLTLTLGGIALGFTAGFGVMLVIALVLRKRK
nr:hypothetical protein [Candidatus Njordarchaeota archaeon]